MRAERKRPRSRALARFSIAAALAGCEPSGVPAGGPYASDAGSDTADVAHEEVSPDADAPLDGPEADPSAELHLCCRPDDYTACCGILDTACCRPADSASPGAQCGACEAGTPPQAECNATFAPCCDAGCMALEPR
jgi:hypothetical protein